MYDAEIARHVLDLVREAVVGIDSGLRVTAWNRAAQSIYGWTAQEALGRDVHELLGAHSQDSPRHRTRAGETVDVAVTAVPTATGAVWVIHDRRLEIRLEQTRHLELVGRLAGGIAHDLNTLLTAVLGYADLTLSDPQLPAVLAGDVEQISSAARRAGELTTQLVTFGRVDGHAPLDVDLDEVVANTLAARRRIAGNRVELVDRPAGALTLVHMDPGQLQRLVLDLVANAAEAMPDGGRLSFETTQADGFAKLTITDTGPGMDPATRERAFEPFFTTKPGHTGLGLSAARQVAEQHGGRVEIAPAEGVGTSVSLYLPLAHA